jgi:isoquinoline 1-oxidoreductase
MGTFGSLTTRMFGPAVRAAAAQARLILTDLAAQRLGAARAALTVDNGVVYVTADRSRHVSYGELAKGQKITHTVDEKAVLQAVEQFRVMGRSPERLDRVEKVTGAAKYAGDVRLPGMLYARLVRPPAHGARLTRVETGAAEQVPGVTVVHEDDLVAVLSADPETAERALGLVRAEFAPRLSARHETIFDHLVSVAPPSGTRPGPGSRARRARRRSVTTVAAWRTPMGPP